MGDKDAKYCYKIFILFRLTGISGGQARLFGNRFDRAELRLDRLNLIFILFRGRLEGYRRLDTTYGTYFQSFFAAVSIIVFAFLSILLSAFQVASAYPNGSVAAVGYWVAIATIISLAALISAVIVWFVVVFVDNILHTLGGKK
jgi:hypothetical protein